MSVPLSVALPDTAIASDCAAVGPVSISITLAAPSTRLPVMFSTPVAPAPPGLSVPLLVRPPVLTFTVPLPASVPLLVSPGVTE